MELKQLVYVPERGGDVLVSLGSIDFNPKDYLDKAEAARALYHALVAFAEASGGNTRNILLWAPDVAATSMTGYAAWTICWEEGPYEWALNLSGEMGSGPWGYTEPYNSFILTFTS